MLVPGRPVPMGRPRVSVYAGRPRGRTPERTRTWLTKISGHALQAVSACRWVARGDLFLAVEIEVSPQCISNGKEPAPGGRGDLDNHVKSALDGLNGIAYHDDSQVVALTARFAPASREGWMRVTVRLASAQ